jgi:membrane protein
VSDERRHPRRLAERGRLAAAGRVLGSAGGRWVDVEAYRLAASLAFYALVSLFPLLILALAVLELVLGDASSTRAWLFDWVDATSSPAVRGTVVEALQALQERGASSVVGLTVGVVGALIGASGVFAELDTALNRIFASERPTTSIAHGLRTLLHDRLWAFVSVLGTNVLLLLASTVGTAWEQIGSAIAPPMGVKLASFGLSTVALGLAVTLCIKWVPDVRVRWSAAVRGGFLAAVLLQVLRAAFGWAIVRFTDYPAYGVVGSVLVVLMWMYVAAAVLLFGASVSAVLDRSPQPAMRLQSSPPPPPETSTSGDVRPAGHRGTAAGRA